MAIRGAGARLRRPRPSWRDRRSEVSGRPIHADIRCFIRMLEHQNKTLRITMHAAAPTGLVDNSQFPLTEVCKGFFTGWRLPVPRRPAPPEWPPSPSLPRHARVAGALCTEQPPCPASPTDDVAGFLGACWPASPAEPSAFFTTPPGVPPRRCRAEHDHRF
jgi:hypothetical protein